MLDPAPPPGFTEEVPIDAGPSNDPVPQQQSGDVFEIDPAMLAAMRKEYPEQAHLSDQQLLDWFGSTRQIKGSKFVLKAPPPPEGFTEAVDLNPTPKEGAGLLGKLAIGAKGVVEGLGDVADMVNPGKYLADKIIQSAGGPDLSTGTGVASAAGALGVPQSQSDGDKLIEAAGRGVGNTIPLGGGNLIASTILGATSGGAAEEARQQGYGPLGQTVAAVGGGGFGVGAAKSIEKGLAQLGERVPNEFLQAAQRAGIAEHILPADAGGPVTRGLTAFAAQTPFGAPPIIEGSNRLNNAAANILAKRAASFSEPQIGESLGETMRGAADKIIKATRNVGGKMYDEAAALSGDAKVELPKAQAVVDQHLARLEATPQVPGIKAQLDDLKALKEAFGKPYSVQGVRDMRTAMFVAPELRNTPVDARLKEITNAAAEDVQDSLRAQGKAEAANAFKAADDYWRQRLGLIDNVLKPIVGTLKQPKSGEAIAKSLNAAMQGNNARFAKFINALPEEERQIARASLLDPLGKDKDGIFSLTRFADNWRDIGETSKKALFGGELTESLDALAKVGRQAKAAQKYGNFSNTGRAILTERTIGTLGTGATLAAGFKTLGAALIGQYGLGRLLASPRVARWLASMPKKPNLAAQMAHVNRLSVIAASEPLIANDVTALQQRLAQAFSQSPQPIAAQEPHDGR